MFQGVQVKEGLDKFILHLLLFYFSLRSGLKASLAPFCSEEMCIFCHNSVTRKYIQLSPKVRCNQNQAVALRKKW